MPAKTIIRLCLSVFDLNPFLFSITNAANRKERDKPQGKRAKESYAKVKRER